MRKEQGENFTLSNPSHSQFSEQHVASFPVSQGKLVSVAPCITEWEKEGSFLQGPATAVTKPEDFGHLFNGWEDEAQCLIKVCHVFVSMQTLIDLGRVDTIEYEECFKMGHPDR